MSVSFHILLTIVIVNSNDNDMNIGLCSLSLLCFSILAAPKVWCSNITVPTGSKNEKITCIIDADPEVDHAVWLWNATDGRKTLGLGQTHEMIYSSYRNVLVSNNPMHTHIYTHTHKNMYMLLYNVSQQREMLYV